MTPDASDATRATLAARIGLNSWLLLSIAAIAGSYVLTFFGLSIGVIKIAGGLLVTAAGWRLLNADQSHDAAISSSARNWDAGTIASRSFFPLTFPLTIGPGSISVAITLGAGARNPDVSPILALSGLIVGCAIVAVAIRLAYRYAGRLMEKLGPTGTLVFLRLSAFILLSIGVQILSDGITERFALPLRSPHALHHVHEETPQLAMRFRNRSTVEPVLQAAPACMNTRASAGAASNLPKAHIDTLATRATTLPNAQCTVLPCASGTTSCAG